MDVKFKAELNKAIHDSLNGLGLAAGRNFAALERGHGPNLLLWMKQLGVDLARAQTEYGAILLEADETLKPPDMAKTTKALERLITYGFCLQIVTRAASPKVVVAQN